MKSKNISLTIGWLYPGLMSTYGDRGNILCLKKRLEWRNFNVVAKEINIGSKISDLKNIDFFFMGGGEDRNQEIAMKDFLATGKAKIFQEMIENNIPGLFICGAYQFLGKYYQLANGEKIPCLNILDLHTDNPGTKKPRCIGNIITQILTSNLPFPNLISNIKLQTSNFVGFENHGGRTYLGKNCQPIGKVITGFGNNGEDSTEGCVYKNIFGTYLHGSLLPKNHSFADYLLQIALFQKYQNLIKLEPLDDKLELQAHNFCVNKFKK